MKSLKTIVLFILLELSITALLISFIILPFITDINADKQALARKQSELIQKEERVLTIKALQKNPEQLRVKLDKINALWPEDKEVSNFIVDLENLANSLGITLKNVNVSESGSAKSKGAKRKEIGFSFDTQADFEKNLEILRILEKFTRFNLIRQISFSKNSEGLVFMKITGTIFYGD